MTAVFEVYKLVPGREELIKLYLNYVDCVLLFTINRKTSMIFRSNTVTCWKSMQKVRTKTNFCM